MCVCMCVCVCVCRGCGCGCGIECYELIENINTVCHSIIPPAIPPPSKLSISDKKWCKSGKPYVFIFALDLYMK